MGSKKLWVENIFGQKIISVIQTIWVQIEFGPNLTKQSRSKRNLVKKILGKKKIWDPKNFVVNLYKNGSLVTNVTINSNL